MSCDNKASNSLRSKRLRLVSEQKKKRPRNGIFGFDRARTIDLKGGGEEGNAC